MDICTEPNILQFIYILKIVFKIVLTIIPLIVMYMIIQDLFKAIGSKKSEDLLKEAFTKSVRRFIGALIVFMLPSIFNYIFTELVPEQTTLRECFISAEPSKIEEYRNMTEEERKEVAAKRKEELEQAAKDREEKEDKEYEAIKEDIAQREEEENQANGSSSSTGTIGNNPNMILKTYTGSKKVNYWELVPDKVSEHPALVVFLHGSGECGNPNGMLHTGLPKFMNNGSLDNYDAIFIAPNTATCSWSSDSSSTKELIDYVVKEYNVDKKHIIITGHSLGGNGTWNMVARYPNFLSAAVPISGCPNSSNDKYLGIPIRSYVGNQESYYKSCNVSKINTMNAMGGKVEYIPVSSPNDTHGTVINVYGDSELINWMLRQ